jgi:hypothetical protein
LNRKPEQTGEIKMTKYLVFKNQPESGQVNEPGSREEMASEIANVVSQDRMLPNYYIAYSIEDPKATFESLKELAKFTVEIDDATAELWVNEIQTMVQKAHNVDDALGEASGGIYQAMMEYNNAIQASSNCKDLTSLSVRAIDRAFEYFEVESSYEVVAKVEEIYEVESIEDHQV